MNQSLVITAIGADRPGIVNELTEVLLEASLNVEDSRMSVLGGEFVVMLLVTGEEKDINAIKQQIETLSQSLNLSLLIKSTSRPDSNNNYKQFTIDVDGMDNPGIVHKLARYLSQHQINIVNMHTESTHAAHTGTPMFSVHMLVDMPTDLNHQQIETDFASLCDELSMDVEFKTA